MDWNAKLALNQSILTKSQMASIPKAEVHVHLEGCFDPEQLYVWALSSGIEMPRKKEALLDFDGLADFLDFLDWSCNLVSSRERLAQLGVLRRNPRFFRSLNLSPVKQFYPVRPQLTIWRNRKA